MRTSNQTVVFGSHESALADFPRTGAPVMLVGTQRALQRMHPTLADRRVVEFHAEAHAPSSSLAAAAQLLKDSDAEAIIGIGGGSAIDTAKALGGDAAIPIAAVPSTFGGAEMTRFYGTRQEGGRKTGGGGARYLPELVVYDPSSYEGLAKATAIGSGLNAWAHALEASYARSQDWLGTVAAQHSAQGLPGALIELAQWESKTLTAAPAHLLNLACLAGYACNANGMGLHHAICHVLGGITGAPHYELNALILPFALQTNIRANPQLLNHLQEVVETDDVVAVARSLAQSAGDPATLAGAGFLESDIPEAVGAMMQSPHLRNNPASIHSVDIERLLVSALEE